MRRNRKEGLRGNRKDSKGLEERCRIARGGDY